jgi:hypothetical protein
VIIIHYQPIHLQQAQPTHPMNSQISKAFLLALNKTLRRQTAIFKVSELVYDLKYVNDINIGGYVGEGEVGNEGNGRNIIGSQSGCNSNNGHLFKLLIKLDCMLQHILDRN